jgi:CheY-like chemotaxis protein
MNGIIENVSEKSIAVSGDSDKCAGGMMFKGVVLQAPIAEGGMATVYKAWHTRLEIPVAVKVFKDHDSPLFFQEAHLTVTLEHPNLVRVFDLDVDCRTGLNYMVMEYVDGCSAYQLLERSLQKNLRPLHQVAALEIIHATALALGAAHERGIVHRDVKSDNILVRSRDGEVKLTDLGLAGIYDSAAVVPGTPVRHSSMAGTLGFISPEVVNGEAVTPASDIYALGVTLYELLTGTLPHGAPFDDSYYQRQVKEQPTDPRVHTPDLHADVVAFISRCLSRDPSDRYTNGTEAASELQPLLHALAGQRRTTGHHATHNPVVLCVDDDAAVLEFEKDTLECENFKPVCFCDPEEALKQIASIRPDVAIIDMNMPQMNGMELCRRIRAIEGCADLGVLMLSGEADQNLVEEAFRTGITDFLLKPLNTSELIMRLNLLTKLRAMNQERRQLQTQLLRLRRLPMRSMFRTS